LRLYTEFLAIEGESSGETFQKNENMVKDSRQAEQDKIFQEA
jgi:hypothetical protein